MTTMSILEALGEGVISAPETVWDGIKRTEQGLEVWNTEEQDKIGGQDIRAYKALKEVVKYGVSSYNSPIEKAVRILLYHFYESLPPTEKKKIIEAAVDKGLYLSSKTFTSMGLSYVVSTRLTKKIVGNAVVKRLVRYISSAELALLSMQGILYKAGAASDRLKAKFPKIWNELRKHNLDMVFFLIEKPMHKYLESIRLNRMQLHIKLHRQGLI